MLEYKWTAEVSLQHELYYYYLYKIKKTSKYFSASSIYISSIATIHAWSFSFLLQIFTFNHVLLLGHPLAFLRASNSSINLTHVFAINSCGLWRDETSYTSAFQLN